MDVDAVADELPCATDRHHRIRPYTVINGHWDTCPAYAYCYTNTNSYTSTIPNAHAGTAWLPEAARGLYAGRRQQWLDDQSADPCDAGPRKGSLWW